MTAAAYLCFEDEPRCVAKLKEAVTLEGDVGAFAALTLARRGHREHMPRALQVLRDPRDPTIQGLAQKFMPCMEYDLLPNWGHVVLQQRVLVLLSNCACSLEERLDLPPAEEECCNVPYEARYKAALAWWSAKGHACDLRDPWLPELRKRKVD